MSSVSPSSYVVYVYGYSSSTFSLLISFDAQMSRPTIMCMPMMLWCMQENQQALEGGRVPQLGVRDCDDLLEDDRELRRVQGAP